MAHSTPAASSTQHNTLSFFSFFPWLTHRPPWLISRLRPSVQRYRRLALACLPSGWACLQVGQKLIEIYDTNGDGVLQPSEFAPKADLRVRLESLFADRAQVCLSFSSFSSFLVVLESVILHR